MTTWWPQSAATSSPRAQFALRGLAFPIFTGGIAVGIAVHRQVQSWCDMRGDDVEVRFGGSWLAGWVGTATFAGRPLTRTSSADIHRQAVRCGAVERDLVTLRRCVPHGQGRWAAQFIRRAIA